MLGVELCDNLLIFIVVGYEIMVLMLVWVLYLLVFDFEVQDCVVIEVCVVLGVCVVIVVDVLYLIYIWQIVEEVLCFYLFVVFLLCILCIYDWLGGCEVWFGDIIVLLIYVLYCYYMLWDDFDRFDFDCFVLGVECDRFVFLFFGVGFCICIGVSFVL